MRADKFLPVLEATQEDVPARDWLAQAAREAIERPRLQRLTRVERASSGRATCRSCRELIGKGEWRFALQVFEEGRPSAIGTIHASCAEAYFGTREVLERARRLTPDLDAGDLPEIEKALAEQRPGLAKTQGSEAEDDPKAQSGSG
jgi:hypothetical protein